VISGSRTLGEFSKQATVTVHEKLGMPSDTIYLTAKPGPGETDLESIIDPDLNFERFRVGTLDGKEVLIGKTQLRIEKSDNSETDLVINKTSRGLNMSSARQNADNVPFGYQIKDSLINLQPNYLLPKIWRNQRVNLKMKVPVGKTIYLDESLKSILSDVENTSDTWDEDMVNKYWTMKSEGLTLVNRAVPSEKPLKK
jgi:hypothetical protein